MAQILHQIHSNMEKGKCKYAILAKYTVIWSISGTLQENIHASRVAFSSGFLYAIIASYRMPNRYKKYEIMDLALLK